MHTGTDCQTSDLVFHSEQPEKDIASGNNHHHGWGHIDSLSAYVTCFACAFALLASGLPMTLELVVAKDSKLSITPSTEMCLRTTQAFSLVILTYTKISLSLQISEEVHR